MFDAIVSVFKKLFADVREQEVLIPVRVEKARKPIYGRRR
jgi:hypothetical protein